MIKKKVSKSKSSIFTPLTNKAMMGAYNKAVKNNQSGLGYGGEKRTTKKK